MSVQRCITKRASLDELHNELLLEILSYFGDQKNLPKQYRATYTLSHVNRRLRAFALSILNQDLFVPTCKQFIAALSSLRQNGRARRIRHVRIGQSKEPMPYIGSLPVPWCTYMSGSLPRLKSFSCWQSIIMPSHLCLLQGSRHLTDLNIVLLEAEFPVDFRRWRKLCTLRVEFCAKIGDFVYDHPVSFPSYAHLTTLAVDDHVGSEWLDDHLRRAHFPSLRVLNLQNATSPPWLVYQFVHRHPTLLEVNVSFDEDLDCWLAFDRLCKLINGTGTWGPEDSESKVDDPNFTIQGIPSLAEETYCVPTRFAFSRVPLYPEATLADQPEGPQRERYTATGLALHIVDQCFWEDYGPEVVRLHQFLERMPRVFPQLAELRLAYDTPYIDDSFQRIMQSCAESLSSWSSLRRLTFSWGRLADDEADPSTDFSWHPSQAPEYLGYVLDGIHPPIYIPREMFETRPELMEELPPTGEPYTFDQLEMVFGLHPREAEIMKRIIRAECDQDMDDDTLMHTPGLPLQAWVARHEPFVLKMMRQLAVNCPTLESIAWYPIGQAIWCWPARWLWRVHREKESHSVRMLTNEFTYRGCSKGDPPEFHILVGQELAVAEEHPAMVRRKDRL